MPAAPVADGRHANSRVRSDPRHRPRMRTPRSRSTRSPATRFEAAWAASASAPPSPGYLDRVRRFADSCEHLASTMTNASKLAGVQWLGRSGFHTDSFPYELRPGGQPARPRRAMAGLRRGAGAARDRRLRDRGCHRRSRVPRTRRGDARRRRRARARRQLAGRIEGWMTAPRSCARSNVKCFVERSTRPASAPAATGFWARWGA